MSNQNLINQLVKDGYIIWNVDETKKPLLPHGVSWSHCKAEDFKINLNSNSYGMRTGLQPNNKYIIGLDFDTWVKDNNEYIQCNNTRTLLKEFKNLNTNNEGLFVSSTEDNRGCLVDITECPDLIEMIELDGRRKIQKKNYCLEILTSFNMVIPPTKTVCKIHKKPITNRQFLNEDKPFLILKEDNDAYDFIYNYINDASNKKKLDTKLLKRYNKEVNYSNLIDDIENNKLELDIDSNGIFKFLQLLSIDRINCYNSWFKIGLTIKNIIKDDNIGLKLFDKFSKLDDKSYNANSVRKNWKLWDAYKGKYDGLNLNYIFRLANYDNPDQYYIKYFEYLQSKKDNEYKEKRTKFEKEVLKILEPPIYLSHNKYHNKWNISSTDEIKHKYLEKYSSDFLNEYFKDETKEVYDVYDFIPDNKFESNKDGLKIFNSFTGFDINKIKPDNENINCDSIKKHINNLCNNKPNTIEFFTQWLAHLIFNTTKRPFIVPVIKGDEGTGKGTIFSIIQKIIGSNYCLMTSTPENDVLGKFNDILLEKVLININEAEFSNFAKTMENFKSLIADKTYNMEQKNKNKITLNNYLWFIITTNNDKLFNISSSNRRFYFIECDNSIANNTDYFNKLYNDIDDDNIIYSFYKYLESVFDSNYNFNQKMKDNKTSYQSALEQTSKNNFYLFINELFEDKADEDILYIKPADLLKNYKNYCLTNGDIAKETGKSMKLKLLMLDENIYGRFRYNNENTQFYKIDIMKIQALLKTKNLI